MGRNLFQKPISTKFSKNRQHFGKFNINFANKSQNQGKFLIAGKYMGPIFGSKFGKCMGQFSFSQRHIPTKKHLSTPRPVMFSLLTLTAGTSIQQVAYKM